MNQLKIDPCAARRRLSLITVSLITVSLITVSLITASLITDYCPYSSGSGFPFVSGAKITVMRPTKKITHMVMAE